MSEMQNSNVCFHVVGAMPELISEQCSSGGSLKWRHKASDLFLFHWRRLVGWMYAEKMISQQRSY